VENNFENQKLKRVAFYTLGCKLNFAETSMISRKFVEDGFTKVSFNSETDVFVINTCSVTQVADKKCRNAIKKATGKGAKVVVIGCYSQLKPDEISKIEGVDLVLGTKDKFQVVGHVQNLLENGQKKTFSCDINTLETFDASYSTLDRTRAFLKIQDGCDYNCAYCTIPLARGKSRNDSISATTEQAKLIALKGIKEIVLTGVNIGDFGRSTNENFLGLVKELDNIEGIERYRISSIEPNLINEEIIKFVQHSKKFVQHFHIPLQSGSDKILAAMGRRYNTGLYKQRVELIKEKMPYSCIGADVIIGFPGESENYFSETLKFIESLNIGYLHIFPYSERPDTKAINFEDKVGFKEKEHRSRVLIELSEKIRKKFYELNFGRSEKVIFESRMIGGLMTGFTSNYIKVEALYNKDYIGKVFEVKLSAISKNGNYTVNLNS
jgi:threonylcarbamoyladenosine tRNA methylthiotransferase MtaB